MRITTNAGLPGGYIVDGEVWSGDRMDLYIELGLFMLERHANWLSCFYR